MFLDLRSSNMKITVKHLRYFCEVADSGTLARAAERLFVAPTALSMQIAQLEQLVGGALFDRSVKPMVLTLLGHFFLPRARDVLAQGNRLEEETRDMATGRKGWLGIGFVRSLLYSVMPLAVQVFRQRHPEVKLELIELLSENQPAALRNERIHIGLSRLNKPSEPASGLRHTPLFDDPFAAAVPAKHPLAKRDSASLAQLGALPFISYPKDPASSYAQHVMAVLHGAGAHPKVGHEAIEIHTALSLVAAGLGYAIVGASVATRGPSDVVFLALPELTTRTHVLAVTRDDDDSILVASMLSTLADIEDQMVPTLAARLRPRNSRRGAASRASGGRR